MPRIAWVNYSRVGQGVAKAFAVLDVVQASEIFRIVLSWLDVEIDEDRAFFV